MARRKWSAEEKMNIVLEGMAPGGNISEVCRTYGILQPSTTSGEISFAVMDAEIGWFQINPLDGYRR